MLKKLSLLFWICLMFFSLAQVTMAKDEEEITIPEDWESSFETPQEYQDKIDAATEDGTCYDLMQARLDLFYYEARYWYAKAPTDSKGSQKMEEVLRSLQELQLEIAKNRTTLEGLAGTYKVCVQAKEMDFLQEPYSEVKSKMKIVAYYIDTDEIVEFTDDEVISRCAKATVLFNRLNTELTDYRDKLKTKVADGTLEKTAFATEILKIAEDNFAQAASQKKAGETLKNCASVVNESNMGLEMISKAKKYSNEKLEDKAGDAENLETRAKMMISIVAEKQVEVLSLTNEDEKTQVIDGLNDAKNQLYEVLKELASLKYDDQQDPEILNYISDTLDQIKSDIKTLDEILYAGDKDKLTDKEKKTKASALIKSASTQIKNLRSQVNSKDKKADTEDERDFVRYAEQSNLYDAISAKKTAQGYKNNQDYDEALNAAYQAMQTAKAGKSILKEVN